MAGYNVNAGLAVALAKNRGVDEKNIKCLVVGGLKADISYGNKAAGNPMFLATDVFTRFLQRGMDRQLKKLAAAVPDPQKQIVYIAPYSNNKSEPFNYVTSMVAESKDIKSMKSFFDGFFRGEVENQQVSAGVGFKTYADAIQGARKMIGLPDERAVVCDVSREAVGKKSPKASGGSFAL